MTRTGIILSAEEYEAAKREARRLGISLAELLRTRPWMCYAGMVASGDPKSSRTIDDVIYGQEE